jgi:hypothetical protein
MTQQSYTKHEKVAERLQNLAKIEAVLTAASRKAVLEHARVGRAIPIWRNGQVIWEKLASQDQLQIDDK